MKICLYALLLLLLIPLGVAAQGDTLTPDTPLIVEMVDGRPIELVYESAGNEIITVYARSLEDPEELDTTLEIIAPDGRSIADNDDHRTDRMDLEQSDSLVSDLVLTEPGSYTVIVDTFSGVAQGSIEVLLITDGGAQPTPESQTPIPDNQIDGIVNGEVAEGETFTYEFDVEEGETITITVRGLDAFDPRISLMDSKGRLLAENDDHGTSDQTIGRFDSRIEAFAVRSSGKYMLEISGFDNTGGEFTLEITRGDVIPVDEPEIETIQESINDGEVYTYTLQAQEGDVYTLSVRSLSDNYDPLVAIYDASDVLLTYNDDHGDALADLARFDSRIARWIAPFEGSYSVEVSGYQGGGGEFEFSVERVAQNAPIGFARETVYTGESNGQDSFSQTFDAQEGEWITITVRGLTGSFDPYVSLVAPDGTVLTENSDHSSRTTTIGFVDAVISNYPINVDGEYSVIVSSQDGRAGSFAITISVAG